MTMRNFWRPLLCLLILAGFMTTSLAQTVTREGLTDKGWTGLRWWLDVNADGKDDFCELTGGSQQYLDCYMSTGSTFAPMQRFTNVGTGSAVGSAKWADVNGDGYSDFCRASGSTGSIDTVSTITCYLGPNFTSVRTGQIALRGGGRTPVAGLTDWSYWFMVDVNNDGRADICYVSSLTTSVMKCRLATDTGFSAESAAWTGPVFDAGLIAWPHDFFDFNGDGTPDYCSVSSGGVAQCLLFKPTGITTTVIRSDSMTMSTQQGAAFVDINGDGNVDYCRPVGQTLACRLSDGTKFVPTDWSSSTLDLGDGNARFWVDINSDGFADFCRLVQSTTMSCRLGKGMSYSSSTNPFTLSDVTVAMASVLETGLTDGGRNFCDPTGSGISTFCRLVQRDTVVGNECHTAENGDVCADIIANSWAVFAGLTDVSLQGRQPLLTSFSDGLGAETRITYLPMSSTDVYTHSVPAAGNGYPRSVIALAGRSPLVYESRIWRTATQTALSGNARYFYKDLRNDTLSGSLGFRERWIFTEASNSLDHVVNFQGLGPATDATSIVNDWREVGQVKYQERFAVANALLPTPQNVGLLSLRQARLNSIGSMARAQATIQPVSPSSSSPFVLLSTTTNFLGDTYPTANAGYRFVNDSVTRSWDWTGSSLVELPKNETVTVMDTWGNVASLVQTTMQPDGTVWKRVTTNNAYQDDTAHWLLGRLTGSTVKSEAASPADQLALYPRSAGNSPNASAISSNLPAAPNTMPASILMTIINTLL